MKFFALIALAMTAQAISISGPFDAASQDPAAIDEVSVNPTVNDRTGTYTPKENMWTGFEGNKTGKAYTYTNASTGGHDSVTRVPSKTSNHRNAVNEGSAHQRAN